MTGSGAAGLGVAIVGCGLIGHKRAEALRPNDRLLGTFDIDPVRARELATAHGARAYAELGELLGAGADVVVVATTHDQLAPLAARGLEAGSHVLVEKPAGLGSADVARLTESAAKAGKLVKVGFNHRFHPALRDLAAEVHSGDHGDLMHLRARYGHGGRVGYEREWRAEPERSGGGELVDQGMHMLDLVHWLAGPLPLHSALLRTHFWDMRSRTTPHSDPRRGRGDRRSPWAMLHVTWTEWKNTFSVEVYCRRAKLQVDGLVRSYGDQRLTIYRMGPELGPPSAEEREYGPDDLSWAAEWEHFAGVIASDGAAELLGGLDAAAYTWARVEDAYAR